MKTTRKIKYRVGQTIFFEGDPGDCIYIVEKGIVRICARTKANLNVQIGLIASGELFGEMALIDQSPRKASAIAHSDVDLLVIPRDYFESKIAAADPLIRLCMKLLMERYKEMRDNFHAALSGNYEVAQTEQRLPSYIEETETEKRRVEAESSLITGLQQNEFVLHFQPILGLRDEKIVGCEALIRWNHPDKGLIGPVNFIPLAEQTEIISEIGHWILQTACKELTRFNSKAREPIFMSVNLSTKQFDGEQLVSDIAAVLRESSITPSLLKLEITESLLMQDPESSMQALTRLKQLGLQIALDDFGTGYSSFSYLHQFPIDWIKVDRSFVSKMMTDPKSHQIVSSLCTLAASIGISVVAEGIEAADEAVALRQFGAEFGQGFYYSKAIPSAEFLSLLKAQRTKRRIKS
jgi:EAL domain-containing protein (putative c-di-GMP-specific phosphodiesterase class I)